MKVGLPAFFLVNNMTKQKIKVIREEMLQVANNVAQEKSIDQDSVFEAMEMALEKAARVKYGGARALQPHRYALANPSMGKSSPQHSGLGQRPQWRPHMGERERCRALSKGVSGVTGRNRVRL